MSDEERINKRELTEAEIRAGYITPALTSKGWKLNVTLRLEYTITPGRINVQGRSYKRGESKRADYVLFYKPGIPLAIVEAKDNKHSIDAGLQQAINYAEMMEVPFVYSSNGDAFIEHDFTVSDGHIEREIPLDEFPTKEELVERYYAWKMFDEETRKIVLQSYYTGEKEPRYYQMNAINRTVEAILSGRDKILLVMASGTGKTFVAFQTIWRLWKMGKAKRILFLADRNILVDQTRVNDFKPFGTAMTKIHHRTIDKAYEIYLALYQAVTGTEEEKNIYKEFSPDFFDLVIIDECHRGSAKEASAWRDVLDYFSGAIQIGMTATPKETRDISNITYFGDPVYTYSLKEGIEDGYLAPFKVVKIDIDKDLNGWTPSPGERDKYGELIEEREYTQSDFDRLLVLEKRTELVGKKISEFLKKTDRFSKTIVFCTDIEHSRRMRRALVRLNGDLYQENSKYIMNITGDDPEGKAQLDEFIDPESRYPVIVTTSRLLSTGVDTQTTKLIVLDRRIQSMTEFKQIIGRGTRVNIDYGKGFFTIMDFKKATEMFSDSQYDGEPVVIYEPQEEESPVPPDESDDEPEPIPEPTQRKYYIKDVEVKIVAERVQYYGKNGKLITQSLKDYTRSNVLKYYTSLDEFLTKWNESERKKIIIDELEKEGVIFEALKEEIGWAYDPFDLICAIVYDKKAIPRSERAEQVRDKGYLDKYGEKARKVLNALLDKYSDEGLANLESMEVLKIAPLNELGTLIEIVEEFGGREGYLEAITGLEKELYAEIKQQGE